MDRLQAELNLATDVEEVRRHGADLGWIVDGPAEIEVYIALTSHVDGEVYVIWFHCPGYPDDAFSVKPVDPESKDPSAACAWPRCEGFRPPNDLCMPLCAEGYALHPEWRTDPRWRWESKGNPLLRVAEELQARLDDPTKYQGRNE